VFLYTPLKPKPMLNTLVRGVPRAMPPVIGWTAVSNSFDTAAAVLFAALFLWQVPHFLEIAWIYRDDHARAGLWMLPMLDPNANWTARHTVSYCLALLLVSLIPSALGWDGWIYLLGAVILGVGFVTHAICFSHARLVAPARRVLGASLVLLPALPAVLLAEGVFNSWAGPR
jgi:protoheme IX farnesyltransferase